LRVLDMWWRVIGALTVTLAALALIDALHLGSILGGRSPEDAAKEGPLSAGRQIFWTLMFVAVSLTSLLAAGRRGVERVRVALGAARRRRD
jgi:hypothetical protein